MKFTRTQLVVLVILGVLTVATVVFSVGLMVEGTRLMRASQLAETSPITQPADRLISSPPSEPTAAPTSTPIPLPTPTPFTPQTRYDLQIAREPENADLRVQRGYAYMDLGAYESALGDFNMAIELDDSLPEAYLGRGALRFYLREWSAALEDFDRALELNPVYADAFAWRGRLLAARGEYDAGLEALRWAVSLDGSNPLNYTWLGQALLDSGDFVSARGEFTTALLLDPRSIEAYVGRAMAAAKQGDIDAAQDDLHAALAIGPYEPAALHGQAWLYTWHKSGHLAEAEQLAQRAVAGARTELERARYLDTLGWVYYQEGRYEEAEAVLVEAVHLATVGGVVVYRDILDHLDTVREAP